MSEANHSGSCFCGKIQFEIKNTGGPVAACHCLDCRKASGAPFMVFVEVAMENYIIKSGIPASIRYAQGVKTRTFCRDCGSAFTYENSNVPDTIDVNTMLLEQPEAFPVQYHLWTKRKLPGIMIDKNIPVFSENSDSWENLLGN
ncbi:GFA family protein [Caldithrix abyssi]|nr:GFA family protein [Caldithrix abyssi]